MKPRLSIVTPSFNQVQFIPHTIRSVLSQEYDNLEYIVIDGGSTDGSVDVIRSKEEHLSYWVSEKDNGHADALNKGFSQSTGEIMAWLNSDDLYTPWSFSIVAEIFDTCPDVDWIVGVNAWWDDEGRLVNSLPVYKNIYDYLLGRYDWIQQESVFWRRSLWEKAGGYINENYKLMVDGELWCRFFRHAKLWHVPVILSGFRNHSENRSKIYEHAVHAEMGSGIYNMRKELPENVLHTASDLEKASRMYGRYKGGMIPLDWNRLTKRIYRNTMREAVYPSLQYQGGPTPWKKTAVEWTL